MPLVSLWIADLLSEIQVEAIKMPRVEAIVDKISGTDRIEIKSQKSAWSQVRVQNFESYLGPRRFLF